MRTQVKLFIALSIFACFAAATPSCTLLNNQKDLCQAANSLCSWTDVTASDTCINACPLATKVPTDCTATNGCAYTASTCAFKTTCAGTAQATCTAANNCNYTLNTCNVNPAITQNCNDGNGACLANLPAYCTKTTTTSCAIDTTPTGTCAKGVATQGGCAAPCSTPTEVDTCTNICAGLTQAQCTTTGAVATNCAWSGTACTQNTPLDCSTVVATCAANAQCAAGKVYDCSTTQASLTTFCTAAAGTTQCAPEQNAWCNTVNTNTCAINKNYCALAQAGNGCATDAVNCSTTGTCGTLDNNACTQSVNAPTCNQNVCTGSFSSCTTSTAGGCQVNGSACAPADASCLFKAGGSCAVNSSGTNGYIIAFCASILAFIFAF